VKSIIDEILTRESSATVKLGEDEIARYIEMFSRPGALTAGLNWYRANLRPESMMAEQRQLLPPIACPVMVLWGLDDAYLSFDLGRRSGEFVSGPFALHAFRDTGHWIQQERPQEVNALLLEFLGAEFAP
jgi:pimeloyl-ACP methyl ester carboxylesterase